MKNTQSVKLLTAGLAVAMVLGWMGTTVRGADAEKVQVTVGAMEVVDTPFPIMGYRVADPDVVKAEKLSERQLRILGLKPGECDVQVTGAGSVAALYSVTVLENIKAVLAAMVRDLDTVPEVDLSINLGRVVIKGEVSSIENWQLLQKVVSLYGDQCVNLAVFRPAPEVMIALRDALEKTGFTVLQGEDAASPGVISVKFSGNNIFLTGQVFSQNDVDKVLQVVRAQDWLVMQDDVQQGADSANKVKAIVNLGIIPTMIELDVVFAGVSDQESRQIGMNLAKAGLLVVDATKAVYQGTVGHDDHGAYGGSYVINAGLEGALKFFAGSGPGRFRTAGHMTFKNDSPEWRLYQSGGTLKVRTATSDRIGLDDIDYGLIMKCRGGLLDSKTASIDVELELSYPQPIGSDYDLKRNRINTSLNCPLGTTMVMGGMKSLMEQTSREGVPFLRSIPIVQWFFSEKSNEIQNQQVLILLSPQLAGAPRPSLPVSDETINTESEAMKTNKQRDKEKGKLGRWFLF